MKFISVTHRIGISEGILSLNIEHISGVYYVPNKVMYKDGNNYFKSQGSGGDRVIIPYLTIWIVGDGENYFELYDTAAREFYEQLMEDEE